MALTTLPCAAALACDTMASLLVLLNRAVSYFNKSNNEMNNSYRERSDDEAMLSRMNDDRKWKECIVCERYIYPQYYNFECERCNDFCLLTQGKERQCVACMDASISYYINILQI
jgi:hypothetical protein